MPFINLNSIVVGLTCTRFTNLVKMVPSNVSSGGEDPNCCCMLRVWKRTLSKLLSVVRHVLLLMPPLIASSFGILQMLLTLWFRPIICFLISAILMLASAYFCVPVLILNYAFCIRSNEILVDGFSFPSGIVYALALSLLCMFIGRHRFRNFDLY